MAGEKFAWAAGGVFLGVVVVWLTMYTTAPCPGNCVTQSEFEEPWDSLAAWLGHKSEPALPSDYETFMDWAERISDSVCRLEWMEPIAGHDHQAATQDHRLCKDRPTGPTDPTSTPPDPPELPD